MALSVLIQVTKSWFKKLGCIGREALRTLARNASIEGYRACVQWQLAGQATSSGQACKLGVGLAAWITVHVEHGVMKPWTWHALQSSD